MAEVKLEALIPNRFEWDVLKSEANFIKHAIDFAAATEVFHEPVILRRSDRNNEERWTALGQFGDRLIVVVFTRREDAVRIISARRARKNEEREYRNQEMGRSAEGEG